MKSSNTREEPEKWITRPLNRFATRLSAEKMNANQVRLTLPNCTNVQIRTLGRRRCGRGCRRSAHGSG